MGFAEGAPSFPAGTTAHVGIALYGVDNKSGHRHLDGDNAFHRNSLDVFQIATERSLGSIWRIRIWHDNKGGTWRGHVLRLDRGSWPVVTRWTGGHCWGTRSLPHRLARCHPRHRQCNVLCAVTINVTSG